MSEPGDVIFNQITGARVEFLDTASSTAGERLDFRLSARARGPMSVPHFHPTQEETIHVEQGVLNVVVEGRTHQLARGSSLTIRRGERHQYFTESELVLRMTFEPAGRTEVWMEQIFGWCNVTRQRAAVMPLLQKVAWISTYEMFEAGHSYAFQRIGGKLLRPIARLFGYRTYDPAYAAAARQMTRVTEAPQVVPLGAAASRQ